MKKLVQISLFISLSFVEVANAEMCERWSEPSSVGELDSELLPEASGLAVSWEFKDRLYHINDKGNESGLVVTDGAGETIVDVQLKGFATTDTEELSIGPCGAKSCVFIGDIGDNDLARDSVKIGWIEEKSKFASSEKVTGSVKLTYPDGPHNAEAMVVHPKTGDLYVFTKGVHGKKQAAKPSYIFRIKAADLMAGGTHEFEFLGQINVPEILEDEKPKNQLVSGAAIDQKGEKLLLLTYKNILELDWSKLMKSKNVKVLSFDYFKKQEAIAFIPGSDSFLVTTESKKKNAEILQVDCSR